MSRSDPEASNRVERELEILTSDYEATRDDQRQAYTRQAAVLSAGIAVFAAFYYLTAENRSYLLERPLLAFALPLAPFLIAQTYIWYEIDTVLRGYYVRALERAIQERISVPSTLGTGVNFPSIGYLSYIVAAPRHYGWQVFVLNTFGWVAVVVLFGGSAVLALLSLPNIVDRIYAIAVYAFMAVLLIGVARQTLFRRARKYFVGVFARYPSVFEEPIDRQVNTPAEGLLANAVRYLLMPRLAELVKWGTFLASWALSLIAYAIASNGTVPFAFSALVAALYLLIFEYLMYQARYQWNDIRGVEQERMHVSREGRKRLPDGYERLSFAVMVVRILTACYLVDLICRAGVEIAGSTPLVVPPEVALPIIYSVIALPFIIAIPYELLREVSDRSLATGRSVAAPVRYAIYLLVGLGFAIRVVIGVEIGTIFAGSLGSLVPLFISASLAGSAETLAIWAIEARVAKSASRQTIRPDIEPLAGYLDPLVARIRPEAPEPGVLRGNVQIRLERDRLLSPWVAAHLASVVFAAIFGLQFLHGAGDSSNIAGSPLVFVSSWFVLAAVCVNLNARLGILIVTIFTFLAGLVVWMEFGSRGIAALIAVTALILAHLFDRLNSHDDFVSGARPLLNGLLRIIARSLRVMLQLLFGKYGAEKVFGRFAAARGSG
jgi:hypothetical protein